MLGLTPYEDDVYRIYQQKFLAFAVHIYKKYDICCTCQNRNGKSADEVFAAYEAANAPTTAAKLWVSISNQFVEVLLHLFKKLCLLLEFVAFVRPSCLHQD